MDVPYFLETEAECDTEKSGCIVVLLDDFVTVFVIQPELAAQLDAAYETGLYLPGETVCHPGKNGELSLNRPGC